MCLLGLLFLLMKRGWQGHMLLSVNALPRHAPLSGRVRANYIRFVDIGCGKREIEFAMKQPQRAAQKKPDYPEETSGSRLAAKARKLASKLTPEQRREHFNGAMAMIYGGAQKATLARR